MLGIYLNNEYLNEMINFKWIDHHPENGNRLIWALDVINQNRDKEFKIYDDSLFTYQNEIENVDTNILTIPYAISRCLCDKLFSNDILYSLALVRPPGHHSYPNKLGCFCGLNSIALTALYYANLNKKILILDLDTHYSGGTIEYVKDNPNIVLIDYYSALYDKNQKISSNIITINTSRFTPNIYNISLKNNIDANINVDLILISMGFDLMEKEPDGIELRKKDIKLIFETIKSYNKKSLFCLEGGYLQSSITNGIEVFLEVFTT